MPADTTTTLSELFDELRHCLEDQDLDAARFIRDGIRESEAMGTVWLTTDEEKVLESF